MRVEYISNHYSLHIVSAMVKSSRNTVLLQMPPRKALVGKNRSQRAQVGRMVYPHCRQSSFATVFYFAHPEVEPDELSETERHAELMLDSIGMPCWIVMDNMNRAGKEADTEADAAARADLRAQPGGEWPLDDGKCISLDDVSFHGQTPNPKRQGSVGYGTIVSYY